MFKKILIANRGEIACRIIKSAQRMGLKTVAVYSDADADALHVQMAGESVNIGPPAAADSYLNIGAIIKAAITTKADAIHPGYGFLAENADFVRAVEKAGITFIGPSAQAIASMGDKIASKKIAAKAGVEIVPGHLGVVRNPREALKVAGKIGYPVMIKASAGGGGKGMRIARDAAQVEESFLSAKREAKSSFGDDRILIEKYITQPRHIEIQILGDKQGNIIHLGERECSIQRRHQKIIEEAPSPFIDQKTRMRMGAQAVALAKAVKYFSAGTVEFIVDRDKNFYFLEMNTRLQVEHPVTEMVTGADLVEAMIRIAAGEKLAVRQEDVQMQGWAIEARLYAEDPFRGFLPSIGRLTRYVPPEESETVRLDTGVYEGAEITMHYDPMIGKLITHGETREEAIATMRGALDALYIRGISHNIPFLSAVMANPRFQKGDISTDFIDQEYAQGFQGGRLSPRLKDAFVAVAAFLNAIEVSRNAQIAGGIAAPIVEPDAPQNREWIVRLNGSPDSGQSREDLPAVVAATQGGATVMVREKAISVESDWLPGQPVFSGLVARKRTFIEVDKLPLGYRFTSDGVSMDVAVLTPRQAALHALMPKKKAPDTSKKLLCPMPGLVVSIAVAEGDSVKAGQALVVVEAMKMENILRAARDGVVAEVHTVAGDSLAVDDVILEFE